MRYGITLVTSMGAKAEEKRARVERVIRFPNPLYTDLKKHARSQNRSINGQVLEAVKEQLEREQAA